MAEKELCAESAEKMRPLNLMFADFAGMGTKRIEEFIGAQMELLGKMQDTNQQWLDRVQAEAKVTSELASKVMAARSVPDAMSAWQDWSSRCLEMMAEDDKRLFADSQKLAGTYAKFLPNGQGGIST